MSYRYDRNGIDMPHWAEISADITVRWSDGEYDTDIFSIYVAGVRNFIVLLFYVLFL